ncbi:MAG: hypothetical protein U9R72_12100 [Chloroflexota bacterium]|nr:hypothetical protein [Chloroflexota bacterium]
MLLNDRARIILFWFTIGLMLVVAILAAMTILRACGGLPIQREPPPSISPSEVSLCPGEQQQFATEEDLAVIWEATGGTISADGLFTAGENPGDYAVTATREGSGGAAGAVVHIIACTPTPTSTPSPTVAPTEAPTSTPAPSATPPVGADAEGDVGAYETGEAIELAPPGIDIRAASINPDLSLSLQPTDNVPVELASWREEGEAFFWISLYDAVPDPPTAYMNWLVVLDIDGNRDTGRPVGNRRINPDFGDEVAVGVSYSTEAEAYEPYALVWDNGQWATGPEVRYTFGESRTVVGLALSLEGLEETLSQTSGVAPSPEAMRGRAAAETYVDGERVIDFYPGLPE